MTQYYMKIISFANDVQKKCLSQTAIVNQACKAMNKITHDRTSNNDPNAQ